MKNWIVSLSLAAIAATGVAAGSAVAAPDGASNMRGMTFTRADALARSAQLFDRLDGNHDGKLDDTDRAAMVGMRFDRIDTDHDGKLSRAEFIAGPAGGHRMGGNDGHMGGKMGAGHMGAGHMGFGRGGQMPKAGSMMARMADTNHDGALSRDEFVAGAAARFDRNDTDHDGKLTPEERRAAFGAMRQHMRGMHRMGGMSAQPGQNPAQPGT